jgi:hypothetical protein
MCVLCTVGLGDRREDRGSDQRSAAIVSEGEQRKNREQRTPTEQCAVRRKRGAGTQAQSTGPKAQPMAADGSIPPLKEVRKICVCAAIIL